MGPDYLSPKSIKIIDDTRLSPEKSGEASHGNPRRRKSSMQRRKSRASLGGSASGSMSKSMSRSMSRSNSKAVNVMSKRSSGVLSEGKLGIDKQGSAGSKMNDPFGIGSNSGLSDA